MEPVEEQLQVAKDAYVALHLFRPDLPPRAGIVILPAMGTPQSYYFSFAAWLARQGYMAATFDYRGIGRSATKPLRDTHVSIADWAQQDCASVIDKVASQLAGRPLFVVGHSLGGQILGLIPNRELIAGAFNVASANGYWRENAVPLRYYVQVMWQIVVPLTVPLFGYFPGRRLGMIGDLPRAVMEQWKRWCQSPEYVVGVEPGQVRQDYANLKLPILALYVTDDEMMSWAGLLSLHRLYVKADVEFQRIDPADVGAKRIGHFGFFRSRFESSLWPLVTQWIERRHRPT